MQPGRAAKETSYNAVKLVKLASEIPPDSFPTLKGVALSVVHIVGAAARFKSNKKSWETFGQFIQSAGEDTILALWSFDDPQAGEGMKENVEKLYDALKRSQATIDRMQGLSAIRRLKKLRHDLEMITNMKGQVDAALAPFRSTSRNNIEERDVEQIVAIILERYSNSKNLSTRAVGGDADQTPPSAKPAEVTPIPVPVFNTSSISGGTIINVAGNQITYGLDEELLSLKMALDKLPCADGAAWDPKHACLPGTRANLMSEILQWARASDSQNILWLSSVAGSGKTAISHSIAQAMHEEGFLASAFFFNRAVESRNTPRLLFTTIARDIAARYPALATEIGAALETEPSLISASPHRQLKAFILNPLLRYPVDRPFVLVIDALDETVEDSSNTALLAVLRDEASTFPPQLRIFVTSRPTWNIDTIFSRQQHILSRRIDVDSSQNREDIAAYINAQARDASIASQMGPTWPEEAVIRDLESLAGGLFIWIATIFAYLRSAYKPMNKLRAIMSKSDPQGLLDPNKKMDALYTAILEDCGDWQDQEFCDDYAILMGAIMAAKRPLSLEALRALHGEGQELLPEVLFQRFGSVLVGLHDRHKPIHILHLSFREFLTDRAANTERTRKFFVCEKEHSQRLAELCLRTMIRGFTGAPIPGTGYLMNDYQSDDSAEDDGLNDQEPGVENYANGHVLNNGGDDESGESHSDQASDTLSDQGSDAGVPVITGLSEQLLYGCTHWNDHISDVDNPSPTIIESIQRFLPDHHTTWIEIVSSTSIFRGSLDLRRWLENQGSLIRGVYNDKSQASILLSLSARLTYAGRLEEALTAAQESVHLYRTLAAGNPAVYSANLAKSLHNLSNTLSHLGQRDEALAAIRESVVLNRTLAAALPGLYTPDLAGALNSLSIVLLDFGQSQEAVKAGQDSVNLYRALVAEQPREYKADLANSLNSLSTALSDLGLWQEGLNATQESVELYRALAAATPAKFNSWLAMSLSGLSADLSTFGRWEDALKAGEEAVAIYRALVANRPVEFNANLANALDSLSDRLLGLGRRDESLDAAQEAVEIYRVLAEKRPAAFNDSLADALDTLSYTLSQLGQLEEGIKTAQEAVELKRALADKRPAVANGGLANSLNTLSFILSKFGRREDALASSEEAIALYRVLVAERPAALQDDLANALNGLAIALSDLGRQEEALPVIREAVCLNRIAAAERPATCNENLATSLHILSTVLSGSGHQEEALSTIREAVDMRRVLATGRLALYGTELAKSLKQLSEILLCRGQEGEAEFIRQELNQLTM
ncbi:hypothetical protein HWV62_37406 [Athelia sp. TMB]|nr:hypothetical protein HWV62_37406 [Athelia sp. TMB]